MEKAIGRFLISWGALERELDQGISIFLDLHGPLALCVTANLGTKGKLDLLRSACTEFYCNYDCDAMDRVHAILNRIADLSGRVRNTAAHGQPIVLRAIGDIEERWTWARYSARKEVKANYANFGDAEFWRREADALRALITELVDECEIASRYVLSLTADQRVEQFGHIARAERGDR